MPGGATNGPGVNTDEAEVMTDGEEEDEEEDDDREEGEKAEVRGDGEEVTAVAEGGEGRGSPQGGRRYGVQVMGSGLLAEMKAKQERRAAGSHKVGTSLSPPRTRAST